VINVYERGKYAVGIYMVCLPCAQNKFVIYVSLGLCKWSKICKLFWSIASSTVIFHAFWN